MKCEICDRGILTKHVFTTYLRVVGNLFSTHVSILYLIILTDLNEAYFMIEINNFMISIQSLTERAYYGTLKKKSWSFTNLTMLG